MSRHIAAALALMLMTGLVLGQLTTLGSAIQPAAPASSGDAGQTAVAFYDAVNRYLETGDATEIDDLLAPDFVNRPAPTAPEESVDGLMRSLESLRATFPKLRFQVTNTIAQDDSVVVDLSLSGDASGTFAGLTVDLENPATGYELLRVRGDQVVGRLGSSRLPPLYETVAESTVAPAPGADVMTRIERQTFDAGASAGLSDPGGFILLMETGTLSLRIEEETGPARLFRNRTLGASATEAMEQGASVRIAVGEAISIPGDAAVRIWNSGDDQAAALIVTLRHVHPFEYIDARAFAAPELIGVERTLLNFSPPYQVDDRPSTLSIGWATLPLGLEMPRHTVAEAELALVTAGSIEATVLEGEAGWLRPNMGLAAVEGRQVLESGQGFSAQAEAEVEYRATSSTPATLLFVNVRAG